MPIFDAGSLAYQSTSPVGTVCTQVWTDSPGGTALTSPRDLTLMVQGTAGVFLTGGSVITLTGVWVPPGGQVTIQGTAQTALWAMTSSGTVSTAAGLATTVAVV